MRQAWGNPEPRLRYDVPPHPPKAVQPILERFNRVAGECAALTGELDDAREAQAAAVAEAKRQAADAILEDAAPVDVLAVEQEYAEKIGDLERRFEATSVATGRAGDELADAIEEHRGAWVKAAEKTAAAAGKRYDAAIAEAVAALDELKACRGAMRWLADFSADEAKLGSGPQFSGGRVRVQVREQGQYRGDHDPAALLAIAARATAEARERRPDLGELRAEQPEVVVPARVRADQIAAAELG